MNNTVINIEKLYKQYRLGTVGAGTIHGDFQRWIYRVIGKEDPFLKIGNENRLNDVEGKYVWALQGINLKVKEGEVIGIIGKNGAGKSTLLKILSRVTGPTKGLVSTKGRIASLLEVGTGFHQELTGRENIFLNGAILGMKKYEIRTRLEEIVEFAGVAKYIDTPVKRYSSGMYVRLAFAVAAHLDPEILVVDEVLAVGDAEFQKKAIGKMQNVSNEKGRTVLFVSHNMASVQNLCQRAIVLENGKVFYEGNVESAIHNYLETTHRKASTTKLANREDRTGMGNLRFIDWKVYTHNDTSGSPVEGTAISGKQCTIEFLVDLNQDLNKIVFTIAFYSSHEFFYTACNSKSLAKEYSLKKGMAKVYIHFNRFPFSEGEYFFNIHAFQGTTVQDWIKNAGIINVEAGDFYNSGVLPISGWPGLLVDYQWT